MPYLSDTGQGLARGTFEIQTRSWGLESLIQSGPHFSCDRTSPSHSGLEPH